jgi:thiol-disulfide isomerase/thioredoxin
MAQQKKVLEVKFWTPLRIASTLIVLGLLAAFGVSSCNSLDPEVKTASRSTARAATLPREILDAENRAAGGANPIKISDYSGKVLLINLWATWCGPCRIETPELVRLHKEFQSRGVEMIALSTEDPEMSAQSVMDFIREYEVDYQVGWANREVAIKLMAGRTAIPQSFIIARDGRILKRFIGFNPSTTPGQLKQALEDALVDEG